MKTKSSKYAAEPETPEQRESRIEAARKAEAARKVDAMLKYGKPLEAAIGAMAEQFTKALGQMLGVADVTVHSDGVTFGVRQAFALEVTGMARFEDAREVTEWVRYVDAEGATLRPKRLAVTISTSGTGREVGGALAYANLLTAVANVALTIETMWAGEKVYSRRHYGQQVSTIE